MPRTRPRPARRRPRPLRERIHAATVDRLRRATWPQLLTAGVLAVAAVRTWPQQIIAAALIAATLLAVTLIWRATDTPRRIRHLLTYRATTRHGRRLDDFLALTPDAFEHAVADLARAEPDCHDAIVHGGTGDRGMDVLVALADGRRVLLQCKRYSSDTAVGSEHVQAVNGTYRDLHHCQEAAIVTTSRFTVPAVNVNASLPRPLRLVDGHGLVTWANGGPPPWSR